MQKKSPWLTLFVSGLALIILSSATTAILMNARFNSMIQSSSRALDAQLAAAGLTQSSGVISAVTQQPSGTSQTSQSTPWTSGTTETPSTVPSNSQNQTAPTAATTAGATKSSTPTSTAATAGTTRITTASTTKSPTTANQYITAEKARQTALDRIHTANLQVVEMELDTDEYPPKYEIKLIDSLYKYEVEIHAVTGQVIEIDKETR